MTQQTEQRVDAAEIRETIRGTVDLYVHTDPELLPRRVDDIGLARRMLADGFASALMWNQFSHTPERATVATGVTGFQMYGSIVLNGTVGGLNPRVTEHAIRMGARYVSLPTLSGAAYQATPSDYALTATRLAGPVPVLDDSGNVLPAVHDIFDVVKEFDTVLGLGYLDESDSLAVLKAARERDVPRIAVLRPLSPFGLGEAAVTEAMTNPNVFLTIPASSIQARSDSIPPAGQPRPIPSADEARSGPGAAAAPIAATIQTYGAERCALMSDTGWNDLSALEWLTLGCTSLVQLGIGTQQLHTMLHETPARVIGLAS
jgi:hypothetical protein